MTKQKFTLPAIECFRGDYYYLSNFYPADVEYDGYTFHSSEAAFQAQKCLRAEDIPAFTEMSPSASKSRGRLVILRPDWDRVKYKIMEDILRHKFDQHLDLKILLQQTAGRKIVENNLHGDHDWGVCGGYGRNNLGKILMKIRDDYINE